MCSDENVQVSQYHASYDADWLGNPTQLKVVPINKWRDHNRVFSFPGFANHLTVIATFPATATTRLDGVPIGPTGWTAIPACPNNAQEFFWQSLAVGSGEHVIDGFTPVGPAEVGVMVHGYNAPGMYSYPGGMNINN